MPFVEVRARCSVVLLLGNQITHMTPFCLNSILRLGPESAYKQRAVRRDRFMASETCVSVANGVCGHRRECILTHRYALLDRVTPSTLIEQWNVPTHFACREISPGCLVAQE